MSGLKTIVVPSMATAGNCTLHGTELCCSEAETHTGPRRVYLVTQALAAAGGHEDEAIAVRRDRIHDLPRGKAQL